MATPRKPLPKEKFLLWMLAAIFGFQILLFAGATFRCFSYGEKVVDVCPELGQRYDKTFSIMIATVLALLGSVRSSDDKP